MSLADELSKLEQLRDSGTLTEDEFQAAKRAVLTAASGQHPQPPHDDASTSGVDGCLGTFFGSETGWTIIIVVVVAAALIGGVVCLYAQVIR